MFQFIQKLLANSVKELTHIWYNVIYYIIIFIIVTRTIFSQVLTKWIENLDVLNFLNKFTIHQTQGCTFKHKSIYPLSHQGLERTGYFFFFFLLFFSARVAYSLVDTSLDTWHLGFSCFHVKENMCVNYWIPVMETCTFHSDNIQWLSLKT